MFANKMKQLGARPSGRTVGSAGDSLRQIEAVMPVSKDYRALLSEFNGPVVFDKGAKFTSDEPSPLNDSEGYQGLEVLYGLGTGKDTVLGQLARYRDSLPPGVVPVGEAPGGNLVCVDKSGVVLFWDHESPIDGKLWRVAAALDDFINTLTPDDDAVGPTDGVVESESFLDF